MAYIEKIEEEQDVQRRNKLNAMAFAALAAPLEPTTAPGLTLPNLSYLVERVRNAGSHLAEMAIATAEGETVSKVMREYIEVNREADHVANKRQEKIRFAEKLAESRVRDHRDLSKRELVAGN